MSTTVTQDMSFLHLISSASVLVQLVMLILVLISFFSWWYIFRKLFVIRNEIKKTDDFEDVFWRGVDLHALHQRITSARYDSGSLERIFAAGFGEFNKHSTGSDLDAIMESTRRAMRATYQREMDYLESHLSFLATVGSVSPYIGLLGTVWGIMNSFRSLSSVTQATIAHVAPGIAEALIATAMGLFAAIPAVVAYNRYASNTDQLATRFESFMEELSNVLQRRAAG
ncbi:protein TolQ [Nitrosomonas supralitoralis]|uniref:Tol-Pal system protein TolQ n=1 Tax=Nitrosomonas supralitoralis TaxID=2116706 RepID=A0A2P7NVW8_9PROT|nr:protein TolQ [Nitrosomonas supralitoralis]PSJ17579.1 protein TolQ [Nitrosomonas supralitoralis]